MINGVDATGQTAVIANVDLNHFDSLTLISARLLTLADGLGSKATAGVVGLKIRIVKSATTLMAGVHVIWILRVNMIVIHHWHKVYRFE